MINISIIEDEPYLCLQLQKYIYELPGFDVISVSADVATSVALIEQYKPQVILSDIRLLDGDAFDILCQIKHRDSDLIFITADDEYALKSIKIEAFPYLLKPVDKAGLYIALMRIATSRIEKMESAALKNYYKQSKGGIADRLVIHAKNLTHFLIVADIVYCSSMGNYTTFVMKDGEKVMATKNIKEYEILLPEESFIRTHQSYIVNAHFVKQMRNDGTLLLSHSSDPIPVSSRKKEIVLKFLINRHSL